MSEGRLVERFTFEIECLTCEGHVTFNFLAEREAATLLSILVQSGRLNPICAACAALIRAGSDDLKKSGGKDQPPPPPPPPAAPTPCA